MEAGEEGERDVAVEGEGSPVIRSSFVKVNVQILMSPFNNLSFFWFHSTSSPDVNYDGVMVKERGDD